MKAVQFRDEQKFLNKNGQVIKIRQCEGCYVHILEWNESSPNDKHESIVNIERLKSHLTEYKFKEVV